ncbi:MAG: FkbM family methyltransferase [Spirochaetota bacterium]
MKINLKQVEAFVRRSFLPIGSRIPVPLTNGLGAGHRAYGALSYSNIFKKDDAEDIYLKSLPLSGKTVCDIGGFIGITAIFFSSRVGDKGHVYCFEPNPDLVQMIRKNRRLNKLHWLDIINAGIGEKEGTLTLTVDRDHAATGTLRKVHAHGDVRSVTVPVHTLDDLHAAKKITPPSFVKIDTEGYELYVLRGMKDIIKEHSPELFIEVHGTDDTAAMYTFLFHHGYRIFHVEHNTEIRGTPHPWARFGHIHCTLKRRR